MTRRLLSAVLGSAIATACDQHVAQRGVLIDHLGVIKERIGPSPPGLAASEGYVSDKSAARSKHADVIGGAEPELLKQLEGNQGLEVLDSAGQRVTTLKTAGYLTDFGAVHASRPDKFDVVLYVYPSTPERGGTFSIVSLPSEQTVATWYIHPPTDRFAVGPWKGQEALFYLQGETLVVRSPLGPVLAQPEVPGGHVLGRVIEVLALADHTVVLSSGDGYTQYHMVSVFDRQGQLRFQEIERENAFRLEAPEAATDEQSWAVWTFSHRWRYRW